MRLALFLCWLFVSLCTQAQERLEQPLAFVAADSTVIWGGGKCDFRGTALAADAALVSRAIQLPSDAARQFKKDVRNWEEEILPKLNLVGGLGDVAREAQAEGAAQVVNAAAPLLLQTADAQYADAIERAVFNALCASASASGPMSFEKHLAAQTLMDATGTFYATDAEGVYVNLYLNTSTHIVTPDFDFVLDQMTAMPFDGMVKLRLTGLGPGRHRLKMRFRMPSWAAHRAYPAGSYVLGDGETPLPTVYVNGREPLQQDFVNGYVVVDREWVTGDEVFFVLPVKPVWAVSSGKKAACVGPLAYALSGHSAGSSVPEQGQLVVGAAVNGQGNAFLEVQSQATDSSAVALEPYMDAPGPVWLTVEKEKE